ncbi:Rad52/Rad22 family DNA repair protein [Rubrivirga sp.]|uniref:Rad52/Rad22 family DNA repair protein n=1 Tax=Rubrivirga sp. TaxID=1885344 RepID=UPI003B51F912
MKASDLPRLAEPFAPSDVEWKPGATTRDKTKGLAMAYLTSRAVQQRFDDVCGPGDWRNEFQSGPDGGVLCGISVRVDRADGTAEWVTKWDGADNSQVEAVKGGLSGAMKRAAVQWGVGRYLYELPATWVRLDDRGRFAEPPRIPREFLPDGSSPASAGPRDDARPEPTPPSRGRADGPPQEPRTRPVPRSGQKRIVRPASSGDGDGRPAGLAR